MAHARVAYGHALVPYGEEKAGGVGVATARRAHKDAAAEPAVRGRAAAAVSLAGPAEAVRAGAWRSLVWDLAGRSTHGGERR